MHNNEIEFNKKRDFSDVINVTFAFIKQEFKPLFSSVSIYTFVPLLAVAILSVFYTTNNWQVYFQNILNNSPQYNAPNFAMMGLMAIISILAHMMIMGLTFEYLHLYNTRGKGNFTRTDVANAFIKDFLSILGFNILTGIILFFAFLFFIIPGIYLSVPLSLIIMVKIAEKKGFSLSWSRCFEIIKSNWWLTLGLILVTSIIISVMSMVFNLPLSVYAGIKGFVAATGGNFGLDQGMLTIFSIISTLGSAWLYIIFYVMLGSHYYSLSSDKKVGNSIVDRINQIGDRPVEDSF